MSPADALGRLQQLPNFGRLLGWLDELLGPALHRYRQRAEPVLPTSERKAVKDAIWGMIDLAPSEVVVVDSPPFQRLRRIRQLGFGYLTYPNAGYSRFEHSLGALNQAERMLQAIVLRAPASAQDEIRQARPQVRLAALLHDIGHMPLSHVAERYYSTEECLNGALSASSEALLAELTAAFPQAENPALAECLSLAVIATPSFTSLLTEIADYEPEDVGVAAMAIVGVPPSPRLAFVSQLITNIVDADKLDYMFRDAWVTRVPVAVDLERFLYKLKCLDEDVRFLPETLKAIARVGEKVLVLGTDVAGDRLAYDLTHARAMLFQAVYLHHKTRAAERVAIKALNTMGLHCWELLAFDDSLFGSHGATCFPEAAELLTQLQERDLPKRAFAFSYSFLPQEQDGDVAPRERVRWARMRLSLLNAEQRAVLERGIVADAARLARALGRPEPRAVWLDSPLKPVESAKNDLLVQLPDKTIRKGIAPVVTEAAAGTHDPTDVSYLYVSGDRQADVPAFLATESLVYGRFNVFLGRAAADHAKLNLSDINNAKRTIEAADPQAYANRGRLRPPSAYARSEAARPRLEALAKRFGQFNVTPHHFDETWIQHFLDQFPEDLVSPMITALGSIQFLSRDVLGSGLASAIAGLGGDTGACVPLTSDPQESASHLAYYLKDRSLHVESLERALEAGATEIYFFDDCLVSGYQASGVVRVWTGYAKKRSTPKASRLSPTLLERLRAAKLTFCFGYAHTRGIDRFEGQLSEVGLTGSVEALVLETRPAPLDAVGVHAVPLRRFLRDVGFELLMSTVHHADSTLWSETRCASRALGWGNDEQLVVMTYGVPKGTLTALWKGGRYRRVQWQPLFPGRDEAELTLTSE